MAGEPYYVTMQVPDAERARAFYGELLGWTFEGQTGSGGYHVPNAPLSGGIAGGASEPGVVVYYAVDSPEDLPAAVARVRALGGEASEPTEGPSGWWAECRDDQGVRFSLGWLRPEYRDD